MNIKLRFYLCVTLLCVLLFLIAAPAYADRYAGELFIPEVDIRVKLIRSNSQETVDREDAAAYFELSPWHGHQLIADHNTQNFANLNDVTVGMTAEIQFADGTSKQYICVDVFDGHNTGKYISDLSGKIVMARADLLMYTCNGYWKNVIVCLWDEAPSEDTMTKEASP